jgi:hypothetical protein
VHKVLATLSTPSHVLYACLWRHAGRVEPGLILGIAGKQTKMTTGSQPVLLCSIDATYTSFKIQQEHVQARLRLFDGKWQPELNVNRQPELHRHPEYMPLIASPP